jgi:cytochrome P450
MMVAALSSLLKANLRRRFSALITNRPAADLPQAPPRLLFIFHGGDKIWPEMGKEFYRHEDVFRGTVQRCSRVVESCSGFSASDYFTDDDWNSGSSIAEKEQRNIIMMSMFELALSDLWRTHGIEPQAVAGVCSGEIAAAYAAGALSLEESTAVACSVAWLVTQRPLKGHFITIDVEFEKALKLSQQSPARLDINLEVSPVATMGYCTAEDLAEVQYFLTENGVSYRVGQTEWPYHTPRSAAAKGTPEKLYQVQPRALECSFYSAGAGGLIPKGTVLNSDHWYAASVSVGMFGSVIGAALDDEYNIMLNVSANPALKVAVTQSVDARQQDVSLLDSSRWQDESELETWTNSFRSLQAKGLVKDPGGNGIPSINANAVAAGVGLLRPDVVQNPYPHYAALRATGPVHFLAEHGFWLVVTYEDVGQCLKQPHLFSNSPGRQLDPALVGADPPQHTRVRRIVSPYFSNDSIQSLQDHARRCAETLLARGRDQKEFDIVSGLATPLTEAVIGHFLGFTEAEATELRKRLGPHKYQLEVTTQILEAWAREYLENVQDSGGAGLGRHLLRQTNGEALTAEEIVSLIKLLWIAGTTTTSMLIATSVLLLLRHPEIRQELQKDLTLLPLFVEEALRFDAPEQMAWRVARENVELSGASILAGDQVRLCLGAANRDPAHFAEPDRVILRRNPNDHLSFAAGPHYCLGAQLARLEVRVALEILLTSWPNFRPARHLSTLAYLDSFHFRALKTLFITPS